MKKTTALLLSLLLGSTALTALAAGEHPGAAKHGEMHGSAHRTGAGQPGDPAKATRTISLVMDDTMRFTPNKVKVKAGETVRFFVKNTGKVPHEMVIGSVEELRAHAQWMRKGGGMRHADPNMITLSPGQQGGLVWQFDKVGTVDFACLIPGHFEAGMVGQIEVES